MCPSEREITPVTRTFATEGEQVMRHHDKQLIEILTTSAGSSGAQNERMKATKE